MEEDLRRFVGRETCSRVLDFDRELHGRMCDRFLVLLLGKFCTESCGVSTVIEGSDIETVL